MLLRRIGKQTLVHTRWCLRGGPLVGFFQDNYPGPFDDLKCIFVHIPKSAGSSVALSLFGHQTGHRRYIDYWRDNPGKAKLYFKFTFVRNPWERLVSAYHFLRAGGMSPGDRAWAEKHITRFSGFEDFIKGWLTAGNIRRKHHFQPQYSFLVGTNSHDVKVDFIGRVENFDADFRTVCDRLGIQREGRRRNKSRHTDYRWYYSNETIEIVRRVYERDVVMFGYDFDSKSKHARVDHRTAGESKDGYLRKDEPDANKAA